MLQIYLNRIVDLHANLYQMFRHDRGLYLDEFFSVCFKHANKLMQFFAQNVRADVFCKTFLNIVPVKDYKLSALRLSINII